MAAPTTVASKALATQRPGEKGWVKVWDPLVRLFHWSFAGAVIIAYISDGARTIHESAGYVALALVAVRLIWGIIGTRHARFRDFVRGPRAVRTYLGEMMEMKARRYLGHNPAGGAMILALLLLAAIAGVSGWLTTTDRFFAVWWMEDIHSLSADLLIACAGLHVVGVVASSVLHKENLVRAMITGRKRP
jgi:cytochrome b